MLVRLTSKILQIAAENLVASVTGAGNFTTSFNVWDLIGVAVGQNVITRVTISAGNFQTAIDDPENCQLTTPEALIDFLIGVVQGLVDSGVLNSGNGRGLVATLDQAVTAFTADRPNATNLLNAFIHQVEGLIAGGILTLAEGQALIDDAQFVIDQLNG